jgi:hypothetical protein
MPESEVKKLMLRQLNLIIFLDSVCLMLDIIVVTWLYFDVCINMI